MPMSALNGCRAATRLMWDFLAQRLNSARPLISIDGTARTTLSREEIGNLSPKFADPFGPP
jgi:hypothetical protein